jgi:mannose-6-phosphate isomerase-like protein (cupin superfamily)
LDIRFGPVADISIYCLVSVLHISPRARDAISPYRMETVVKIINHEDQLKEEWRVGVVTQMRISALVGSNEVCIFEQWCAPGTGAPIHSHSVEEVLTVLSGAMEVRLGDERAILMANESVIVPAGLEHGFLNVGSGELHVQAILAAPFFEAILSPLGEATVRWRSTVPQ